MMFFKLDYFNPACFKILFAVPCGKSSFVFPGIVTLPFLVGCLKLSMATFCTTRSHPFQLNG